MAKSNQLTPRGSYAQNQLKQFCIVLTILSFLNLDVISKFSSTHSSCHLVRVLEISAKIAKVTMISKVLVSGIVLESYLAVVVVVLEVAVGRYRQVRGSGWCCQARCKIEFIGLWRRKEGAARSRRVI